jgi:hypothetical protein
VPAFAAGTALWATALLLVSIPKVFAVPIRILGIASAILFVITAARIFWGEPLLPTATPLPSYAYPLLVANLIGWIWTMARTCIRAPARTATGAAQARHRANRIKKTWRRQTVN